MTRSVTDREPIVPTRSAPFCSSCGRALEAGARFCGVCGAERLDTTDPDATIVAAPVVEPRPAVERTTVMREYEDEPVVVDDDPVLVADRTPYGWWLLGALAAAILLFVLIAAFANDDDDDDRVTTATTLVDPVATTAPPAAVAPAPVVVPDPPVTAAPSGQSGGTTSGSTSSGSGSSGTGSSAGPVARQQPATAAQPFELTNLELVDDGGTFSGRADIRNTGDRDRGGSFTVRLYDGGRLVGTLTGTASSIPGGSSSTVTLSSSDAYVDGVDRYEFSAQPS